MFGKPLTVEERQAGRAARREGRQQLVGEATAAVNGLLADASGPVPEWARRHAEKAKTGYLRSLVALKCGDCCCWQKAEIAACTVTHCPLFPLRPFKR